MKRIITFLLMFMKLKMMKKCIPFLRREQATFGGFVGKKQLIIYDKRAITLKYYKEYVIR